MSKNKRFVEVYSQGSAFGMQVKILVDRETGVNYVWSASGYAGGLSVMLDREGKPVITNPYELEER